MPIKKKLFIPILILACLAALWLGFHTITHNAITGDWSITSVLDENGTVIMCSPEELPNWPAAQESSMVFQAAKGQFTISDSDHIWNGTYAYSKSNLAGTIYTIELTEDGTLYQGLAAASNQLVFGGGSNRVLTLTVLYENKNKNKNYTLYFSMPE